MYSKGNSPQKCSTMHFIGFHTTSRQRISLYHLFPLTCYCIHCKSSKTTWLLSRTLGCAGSTTHQGKHKSASSHQRRKKKKKERLLNICSQLRNSASWRQQVDLSCNNLIMTVMTHRKKITKDSTKPCDWFHTKVTPPSKHRWDKPFYFFNSSISRQFT